MKQTFVISAFPACGKSYCFRNHQDIFSMLDSDSSEFSWIKDSEGNNTKERNPNFPSNYIDHIKENIGKVDVVFVSSHEAVRKALAENNIKTIIVYPNKCMKEEWIRRFKERGNNEAFIKFISDNWNNFINDIQNEDYGFLKQRLSKDTSYLDLNFLQGCYDNGMGCMTFMWANC
ncbi:hypothetical protein [Clostridium sp. VAP41]|uniref:hypothetical protein n=1 Tax=Clostridium sp. VAP41 TaxID=2949979 RepID=UPI002079B994|nr:hypothetical protein [Clostridium sp. VAP41]